MLGFEQPSSVFVIQDIFGRLVDFLVDGKEYVHNNLEQNTFVGKFTVCR